MEPIDSFERKIKCNMDQLKLHYQVVSSDSLGLDIAVDQMNNPGA